MSILWTRSISHRDLESVSYDHKSNHDKKELLCQTYQNRPGLPTGIKLDDLDLIKKNEDSSAVIDLRTVYNINIVDKRSLVELEVIGSEGNVLQDMGSEPVRISLFGEMMGPESKNYIERLVNKFNANKPIEFSSDMSNISEISKVVIEQFCAQELAGSPYRYKYYITLRECK